MIKNIVLFFLCFYGGITQANAQVEPNSDKKVLLMKDGSIIRGVITEQNEYSVKIIDIKGDTVEYSFKYIAEINDSEAVESNPLIKRKFHKTEGYFLSLFVNAPSGMGMAVGKRMNSRLNLGGEVSIPAIKSNIGSNRVAQANFGTVSISGYLKYYLNDKIYGSRFFVDANAGMIIDGSAEDNENTIKPYIGASFGIHLASRKKARFYWRLGAYGYFAREENVIREPVVQVVTNRAFEILPTVTILGIEF